MSTSADLPSLWKELGRLQVRVAQLERQQQTTPKKIADLAGPEGDVVLSGVSNNDTLVFLASDGKWHAQ